MKRVSTNTKFLVYLLVITFSLSLAACALFKGFRSGRGVVVEKPPYFKNFGKISTQGAKIGHLPIMLDKRAGDPTSQNVSQALLAEMNSFLAGAGWTIKMEPINLPLSEAPDLYFGNPAMFRSPVNSSSYEEPDQVRPPMVLFYRNASKEWKTKLTEVAETNNVDYVLFTTIGLSEYFIRQTNLLGKKELALGNGYRVPIKWLTSLEDPIEVLHITGALLDKTGKILRVGAEGIIAAKPASILESAINLQNMISEDEIKRVMAEVYRDDLPGKPLAYHAALQNLVAHLLQRDSLLMR